MTAAVNQREACSPFRASVTSCFWVFSNPKRLSKLEEEEKLPTELWALTKAVILRLASESRSPLLIAGGLVTEEEAVGAVVFAIEDLVDDGKYEFEETQPISASSSASSLSSSTDREEVLAEEYDAGRIELGAGDDKVLSRSLSSMSSSSRAWRSSSSISLPNGREHATYW